MSRSVLERFESDLAVVRRAEQAAGEDAIQAAIEDIPAPMHTSAAYGELSDANHASRYCEP